MKSKVVAAIDNVYNPPVEINRPVYEASKNK